MKTLRPVTGSGWRTLEAVRALSQAQPRTTS